MNSSVHTSPSPTTDEECSNRAHYVSEKCVACEKPLPPGLYDDGPGPAKVALTQLRGDEEADEKCSPAVLTIRVDDKRNVLGG